MSNGGSRGSGGGGANYNKVGALLLAGLGVVGAIIILGGGGGDDPPPSPTSPPQVAATVPAAPTSAGSSSPQTPGFDKEALRRGDSNATVLTITAFGMPARVGVQAQNASEVKSQGVFDSGRGVNFACNPDTQYPNPCVTYIVVQRGATVTVTAGDSRAGFWPVFEYLRGGGCDRQADGSGRDVTCTLSLFQDAEITAMYHGESTRSGRYQFPKCPVPEDRGPAASSAWVARCQ